MLSCCLTITAWKELTQNLNKLLMLLRTAMQEGTRGAEQPGHIKVPVPTPIKITVLFTHAYSVKLSRNCRLMSWESEACDIQVNK